MPRACAVPRSRCERCPAALRLAVSLHKRTPKHDAHELHDVAREGRAARDHEATPVQAHAFPDAVEHEGVPGRVVQVPASMPGLSIED